MMVTRDCRHSCARPSPMAQLLYSRWLSCGRKLNIHCNLWPAQWPSLRGQPALPPSSSCWRFESLSHDWTLSPLCCHMSRCLCCNTRFFFPHTNRLYVSSHRQKAPVVPYRTLAFLSLDTASASQMWSVWDLVTPLPPTCLPTKRLSSLLLLRANVLGTSCLAFLTSQYRMALNRFHCALICLERDDDSLMG